MPVTRTPSEAAEALNMTVEDLAFWRTVGIGPAYIELGPTMVRYCPDSLDSWVQGQLQEEPNECCPWCGDPLNDADDDETYSGDHDR